MTSLSEEGTQPSESMRIVVKIRASMLNVKGGCVAGPFISDAEAAALIDEYASSHPTSLLITEGDREDLLDLIRTMGPGRASIVYTDGIAQASVDVLRERIRQVEGEGFDSAHDDEHDDDSLATAAACYAAPEPIFVEFNSQGVRSFQDPWPWIIYNRGEECRDRTEWNKSEMPRRRQLVIAAALIIAEIERMDRAAKETPDAK